MNKQLANKCKKIKIVLTDVDGVLTDGGMYYTAQGDFMKKFHVLDGMGVTLLRKFNIPTIIITKENTSIVKQWAKKMKIKKLYDGILDKEKMTKIICKKFQVLPSNLAYIGDDVNDIGLLKKVGLSATPKDGISKVKKICDYICNQNGGHGCFRELADMILSQQKDKINY